MYQALYRVWRPQRFSDVVGQTHVTKTLQNAIAYRKNFPCLFIYRSAGDRKNECGENFRKSGELRKGADVNRVMNAPSARELQTVQFQMSLKSMLLQIMV